MRYLSDRYRKPVLDNVYIPITLECNRNCKCCVTCSPLVGSETRVTLEQFERTIRRLIEISDVKTIESVDIAGGEPLLHPDILKILEFTRNIFMNSTIRIRTNGILLPEFIEKNLIPLKELKIDMEYSQYPEVRSDKLHMLKKKYDLNIFPHFYEFNFKFNKFLISEVPNYTMMNEEWDKCCDANACHVLRIMGDKAYYTGCSAPVFLDILDNHFGTDFESLLKKGDRVDIFDPNTTLDDILNFHQPIHFCAHCRRRNSNPINNDEISEKSKDEWIYQTNK